MMKTFELSLNEAERLKRPIQELQVLWTLLAAMSARGEDAACFYRVAPAWLEQIKCDSGFYDWQKLGDDMDEATRAIQAYGIASERYQATPEDNRIKDPSEAIKDMVSFVVFAIAVSARVFDVKLANSLPALLEPFAPLNPIVDAMRYNALGTQYFVANRREKSLEFFLEVIKRLETISGDDLVYVSKIRAAINHAIANIHAALGIQSKWIDLLEHEEPDPNQRVGVHYIRKMIALQHGDWEAAENHRQQAELLALQSKASSMFSTLWQQMEVHAMAGDLTGLKQVRASIHDMAAHYPGWEVPMHISDALYARQCGDLKGALGALQHARTMEQDETLFAPWKLPVATIEMEILVTMDKADEALRLGQHILAESQSDGMSYTTRNLVCAIALAEARLGNFDKAFSLMEKVIAEQQMIGISGLLLGRSYEHCARIAIWADDADAFEKYAALTAEQYRPGRSSVLGALYERLVEEARQAGIGVTEEAQIYVSQKNVNSTISLSRVTQAMVGCDNRSERAHRALALLSDGHPPSRGHLFVISEDGLILAASNTPCDAMDELVVFAQQHVETEIDDGECTMTATNIGDALKTTATRGIWEDRDGTKYRTLLLNSEIDGNIYIAGVALLTNVDSQTRIASVMHLASTLARKLIDSGDAKGVLAA